MSLVVFAAPFPFLLIFGAISDLARYIIPNRCYLGLIGAFFIAFLASGLGWANLGEHALVALAALAAGFALFAAGVWGAADGKFLPAALLWLGPSAWLHGLIYTALLGGLLSLLVMLVHRTLKNWPILALGSPSLRRLSNTQKPHAPYGAAIALGALLAFPHSDVFAALTRL